MRLADFIEQHTEHILAEWVAFAEKSCAAGASMDISALRDHAVEMLKTIVADLRTPQTDAEQTAKSKGEADSPASAPDTPAEAHGAERAQVGFTVGEMVSEYRALRASVIRLWTAQSGSLTGADLEDLMRFNETIDQALAESTDRFTEDVDRSREIFVGILGHDLRTPLNAVIMASQFILDTPEATAQHLKMTERTLRSARRMNGMVSDLLDFTLGRLGSGVPITRADVDLGDIMRQTIDEATVVHPESDIQFTASGDLRIRVDAARIAQMVANLIGNAVQYGTPKALIGVSAAGEASDVVLRVHNSGSPIPATELSGVFSPFKRLAPGKVAAPDSNNLGLGLYIVERIVTAHGGSIDVRSSAGAGTLFSVRLPRDVRAEALAVRTKS